MTTALETLRAWVGQEVVYQGRRLRVVELLEDIPDARLVLEECELIGRQVQTDQFGAPHRRTPRTWTLPLHDRDGVSPNPLLDEIVLV